MAGRVLGAIVVAATTSLALLGLAGTAGAHTNKVWADCIEDKGKAVLSVELFKYNKKKPNSVTVTHNGTEKHNQEFDENFTKMWDDLDPTADHTIVVEVKAWDDPNGDKKWSFTKTLTVTKCVEPTTTTPPSQTTTTSVPVPSSETPTPSTTATPPGGAQPEPPLAATGASPVWLLVSGLGLVGAGAAALILVRRKRAS